MQINMNKVSGISERISEIIVRERITTNDFAKKLGYNRSQTLYDIVNGKSKPSADFFFRFINAGFSEKYSMDWVIAGKIYPLPRNTNTMTAEPPAPYEMKPACKECEAKERLIEQLQKENDRLWKMFEGNNGRKQNAS